MFSVILNLRKVVPKLTSTYISLHRLPFSYESWKISVFSPWNYTLGFLRRTQCLSDSAVLEKIHHVPKLLMWEQRCADGNQAMDSEWIVISE